MEINWKMTISLIIVAIIGLLMIYSSVTYQKHEIKIDQKCRIPWSDQTTKEVLCTRPIYCGPINKWFYYSECKRHDTDVGEGVA